MKKLTWVGLLAAMLLTTACGGEKLTAAAPTVIRVGYYSSADLGDIPSLMAHDRLAGQNYKVELTYYASVELVTAALVNGEIEIAYGSLQSFWAATAKGAPVKVIAEQIANEFLIAARSDIKTCADLAGKSLGVHSELGTTTAAVHEYINTNCPGTEANFLVIPGSDNRAAAMLSGDLDAAILEFTDYDLLQTEAPGQFNMLINLASGVPNWVVNGVWVNETYASAHPQVIKDYLKALLETHRALAADHELLLDKAQSVLETPADSLKASVDYYFKINAWDVNGGLTSDKLTFTLNFMGNLGTVDKTLTVEQGADLSYLNAVLDEIGRK